MPSQFSVLPPSGNSHQCRVLAFSPADPALGQAKLPQNALAVTLCSRKIVHHLQSTYPEIASQTSLMGFPFCAEIGCFDEVMFRAMRTPQPCPSGPAVSLEI
jgi:hypothetical protein